MTPMCSKVGYIRESHHILASKLMLGHAQSMFVQAPSIFYTQEKQVEIFLGSWKPLGILRPLSVR